jgi:hypothetical protein
MAAPAPIRLGRPITCFCGACAKCRRREVMRRYRAKLAKWDRIAQDYEHLLYVRDVLCGPDCTQLGSTLVRECRIGPVRRTMYVPEE